jgi:hypothetical protein
MAMSERWRTLATFTSDDHWLPGLHPELACINDNASERGEGVETAIAAADLAI